MEIPGMMSKIMRATMACFRNFDISKTPGPNIEILFLKTGFKEDLKYSTIYRGSI